MHSFVEIATCAASSLRPRRLALSLGAVVSARKTRSVTAEEPVCGAVRSVGDALIRLSGAGCSGGSRTDQTGASAAQPRLLTPPARRGDCIDTSDRAGSMGAVAESVPRGLCSVHWPESASGHRGLSIYVQYKTKDKSPIYVQTKTKDIWKSAIAAVFAAWDTV